MGPMTESAIDPLFEPFDLNAIRLANRIVMAPMTRGFARGGLPDERSIDYYARRAASGVGLIITEGIAPAAIGEQFDGVPVFGQSSDLTIWKRIVDGVHQNGGKIIAQLWHAGIRRIQSQSTDPAQPSLGPDVAYPELIPARAADPGRAMTGRAMSLTEVRQTIESFVVAAEACVDIGFDGVELHGAHGYLLDQFFWSVSNTRKDGYGGDLESRLRVGLEIVQGIKQRTPSNFAVGLRFSEWKLPDYYDATPFGDPAELAAFLQPFVTSGIDYFHASTRRFSKPAFSSDQSLAGWTKQLTGKPTIAVGSVGMHLPTSGAEPLIEPAPLENNLDEVRRALNSEEFDLIAVGRALLADPDWVQKIKDGRAADCIPYGSDALKELY